jgi:hypothetical protein
MEEVGEGRGVTALGGRVQWAAMWQKNIIWNEKFGFSVL